MQRIITSIKTAGRKLFLKTAAVTGDNRGEGAIDHAVAILVSVVIGALLLAGLYALFGDTILPVLTQKIQEMFNYNG